MNFDELYPKNKEYYYLLMNIKTTAECNVSNCVIDKQKAKLLMRYINKKEKEKERINNIINELEKELKNRIKNVPDTMAEVYEDESILNKLQELKGADKE